MKKEIQESVMENTTLVIMAAGIGSRFGGGVKQLTSFGPSGEIIMDYSIYDALEAGFNKVVFVIRKNMFEDFKQIIGERIAKQVPVEYAFQELEDIPEGFLVPPERKKPWGTGQAILACKGIVKEPFAVINADDYYGKDAFRKVHDYLVNAGEAQQGVYQFCMAGFVLENTLSEHGGVTRGLCRIGENGELSAIRETKNIIKTESGAAVSLPDGTQQSLDAKSLVSMNFWGFTPDFIDELEQGFAKFLSELGDCTLTGEYLLPTIVDGLIQEKRVKLTVLPSRDKWFGVTFREDVPYVKQAFLDLVQDGVYPEKLF
jgi:hypothetical protein